MGNASFELFCSWRWLVSIVPLYNSAFWPRDSCILVSTITQFKRKVSSALTDPGTSSSISLYLLARTFFLTCRCDFKPSFMPKEGMWHDFLTVNVQVCACNHWLLTLVADVRLDPDTVGCAMSIHTGLRLSSNLKWNCLWSDCILRWGCVWVRVSSLPQEPQQARWGRWADLSWIFTNFHRMYWHAIMDSAWGSVYAYPFFFSSEGTIVYFSPRVLAGLKSEVELIVWAVFCKV